MARFVTGIPSAAKEFVKGIAADGRITDDEEAISSLADYVIMFEEPLLLTDMCAFISGSDYEATRKKVGELFSVCPEFSYSARKRAVTSELADCLFENDELNFTGFLYFRLSDYESLLFSGVNAALGEVIINREYERGCLEIKNFVKNKKSSVREAHIYGCSAFDENGEEIKPGDDGLFSEDFFTEGDRLLALLIEASPEKIFIHVPPDSETLDTVKKIFPLLIYS